MTKGLHPAIPGRDIIGRIFQSPTTNLQCHLEQVIADFFGHLCAGFLVLSRVPGAELELGDNEAANKGTQNMDGVDCRLSTIMVERPQYYKTYDSRSI